MMIVNEENRRTICRSVKVHFHRLLWISTTSDLYAGMEFYRRGESPSRFCVHAQSHWKIIPPLREVGTIVLWDKKKDHCRHAKSFYQRTNVYVTIVNMHMHPLFARSWEINHVFTRVRSLSVVQLTPRVILIILGYWRYLASSSSS